MEMITIPVDNEQWRGVAQYANPREQSGLEKSSRHCRAHRLNTLAGKIVFDIKNEKKEKRFVEQLFKYDL